MSFIFLPSKKLSASISLFWMILYCRIQLSFPPLAYNFFSSAENFKPYHDFAIVTSSSCFSVIAFINWIVCVLCPLFVTATNLPDLLTTMFKGRSPKGKLLPAGERLQPFGSVILLSENCFDVWQNTFTDTRSNSKK